MQGVHDGEVGMSHLTVSTKSCGYFVAPIENITLHVMSGYVRVLFRDDPEWRVITEEEYERLMCFL